MSYTQFLTRNYALESIPDHVAQGRAYFETLEGKLSVRKIELCRVPPDAWNLPLRPEYTPTIHIFQVKEIDNFFLVFLQRYFVHQEFLDTFEKFLRQHAANVETSHLDKVPAEFQHYYDTPFSLVTCDMEETRVSLRVAATEEADVLQPVGRITRFKGVNYAASATLRMIEPAALEQKLQEMELQAAYFLSITRQIDVNEPTTLIYYEHKESWNHFVLKQQ